MADQLQPLPLVTPGFKGLNAAQSSVPDLDPAWAIICNNFAFDPTGRLACRYGWSALTVTPISFAVTFTGAPAAGASSGTLTASWAQATGSVSFTFSDGEVYQGHVTNGSTAVTWNTPLTATCTTAVTVKPAIGAIAELVLANGTTYVISAMNNQLYSGTTTLTNITGSLTPTGNNWQFVSFNGAIYGVQAGHPMITWNGVGNAIAAPLASPKSFTGSIAGNIMTVTAITSGVLGNPDPVTGTSVTAGTVIVSQLSGVTGGIGTYQLNQAMTIASEALTVAAGTVPTGGNAILSAFGRLWVVGADLQTISYCALLDATTWNGVSAGSLNMATVWTKGTDSVIAVAAAGAKLVVFGGKQIIIYADSAGSALGLNPQNLYGYDTIEGTGCAARDTVQSTGEGDLTFLSYTGVQSLGRLLAAGRDNPVAALDTHIHDYFNGYFANEVVNGVRSAYSPANRQYIILLPVSQQAFCYDTRYKLQGDPNTAKLGELPGALRVTQWGPVTWSSLVNRASNVVLFGENGTVGQYGGYFDNLKSYTVTYASPNVATLPTTPNFENHMKILKRLKAVLYTGGTTVVNFFWGVDFGGLTQTKSITLPGSLSEYNLAQFGINEFGGGAGLSIQGVPLSNSGRWMQFGLTAVVNGYVFALQQLDAFVKIGNMV